MKSEKSTLTIIVIAQFCCTSLWFASNAVMGDLIKNFGLSENGLGQLTAAIQFGFISGTLVFALLSIADRYSPSKVFFCSALLGAVFNLGIIWEGNNLSLLTGLRFLTGFFLAGIYPVGMKIAADYFQKGLGKSLGFLVGALVLGTAFPHLLKGLSGTIPWRYVIYGTSLIAVLGGILLVSLVPDGPYRKASQRLEMSAIFVVFKNRKFNSAAIGYFGHMWELYTFWAFVPIMLATYSAMHPNSNFNISILSFIIIAIGGLSCVIGGYLSESVGSQKIAFWALASSLACCLLAPLMFTIGSSTLFITFLLFWGMVVVADSPQFSTIVAHNANANIKGTALTIVNCIGFSITIISILLISKLNAIWDSTAIYLLLAIGPVIGLFFIWKLKIRKEL